MKTVKEVSDLTGISVRTLHHYDAIGLLKPSKVTEAGYRLYDEASLSRLQSILFFKELRFPLKEIKSILDSPGFDQDKALEQQIHLLEMQKDRLERIIALARSIQQKGVSDMNFEPFDRTELEKYEAEAKKKWNDTDAWQEYASRPKKSASEQQEAAGRLMDIFRQIGALRDLSPSDSLVQEKIGELQNFITENYYTCTDEILKGLGQMYVSDPRMQKNIDKAGGIGTAEFTAKAITERFQ